MEMEMSSRNIDDENKQNSYDLTITGLSPIYIGSGDKYSNLDYIAQENKIHILDFDRILAQIPFEAIDDLTNDITKNFRNNRWSGNVEEFLNEYNITWQDYVDKSYELIGAIGQNEINKFIKTGEQIYIPGSSLKGAIRTAILFKILKEHPDKKQRIERGLVNYFNDREIKKLIQSEDRPDGKLDLLRALIISDSKLQKEITQIVKSNVYHLKDRESTIPVFNEILAKDFVSKGQIKINRKLVDSNALYSRYFNLQKIDIITAINDFSKEIIEFELQVFREQGDPNLTEIVNFYENLKTQLKALGQNECIIRLGQGSSALGITLFLNFSENKQIINKYKGLEVIHFKTRDPRNPGYAFAEKERIKYFVDRKSEYRPRLNERWLCKVPSTKRNTKYVSLIEKVSQTFDLEQQSFLFPLTRKFVMSQANKLIFPFGWVKLKWE